MRIQHQQQQEKVESLALAAVGRIGRVAAPGTKEESRSRSKSQKRKDAKAEKKKKEGESRAATPAPQAQAPVNNYYMIDSDRAPTAGNARSRSQSRKDKRAAAQAAAPAPPASTFRIPQGCTLGSDGILVNAEGKKVWCWHHNNAKYAGGKPCASKNGECHREHRIVSKKEFDEHFLTKNSSKKPGTPREGDKSGKGKSKDGGKKNRPRSGSQTSSGTDASRDYLYKNDDNVPYYIKPTTDNGDIKVPKYCVEFAAKGKCAKGKDCPFIKFHMTKEEQERMFKSLNPNYVPPKKKGKGKGKR